MCPKCGFRKNKVVDAPSAGGEAKGKSGVNPLAAALNVELKLHDGGNAERLLLRVGERLRFCGELGGWHVWTEPEPGGGLWKLDVVGRAGVMALEAAREIEREAGQHEDEDRRAWLLQWARKSQDEPKLAAMLKVASREPELALEAGQLDSDRWLLNVRNGTLDLRPPTPDETVWPRFRRAERRDLLSKCAGVSYDPGAKCPLWLGHLERIFRGEHQQQMMDFAQRLAAYLLFGGNNEQVLVILWGDGGNGKSKFIEPLMALLGDYAEVAAAGTLLASEKPGNNEVYALAMLKGARLVLASEPDADRKMAEGLVKVITGGEKILARFSHSNFFRFQPEFTPVLMTNHLPTIYGLDEGIWRRILLVPFTQKIAAAERDLDFGEKLSAEGSGILNWALEGLWTYHALQAAKGSGLAPPAPVTAAGADYRAGQDILAGFFEDCCDISGLPAETTAKDTLFKAYVAWCEVNAVEPVSMRRFHALVLKRGSIGELRTRQGRMWTGVLLKSESQSQQRRWEPE